MPKGGFKISGEAKNYPENTQVVLQEIRGAQPVSLDTTTTTKEGTFSFNGKANDKSFARVLVGGNDAFFILDNAKINVSIDRSNPRLYTVAGTSENSILQNLMNDVRTNKTNREYMTQFLDTVKSPLLAYYAMQFFNIQGDMAVYEKVEQRLKAEMPNSELTQTLSKFIADNKAMIAAKQSAEASTGTGAMAQEIKLPSPDGKEMALSQLRGKVVLLDFWASWCGPCRKENPNVVNAYNKYKDKGFEVFSVSLDKDKQRWIDAIEKDKLAWKWHVSDLQFWNSAPARAYGVTSIPASFLIDKDGKIIGKNLRGPLLDAKLKEIFG